MHLLRYSSNRSNTLFPLVLAFWAGSRVNAQAINPDKVNFKTIAIWNDLNTCLTNNIFGGVFDGIWVSLGCQTNACFCRADTLGKAIVSVSSAALSDCSDYQDQSTAVSVLTAYCATHGYTGIISPTIPSSDPVTSPAAGSDSHSTSISAAPSSISTLSSATSTSFSSAGSQSFTTSVRVSFPTSASSSSSQDPSQTSPSGSGSGSGSGIGGLSKSELIGMVVGILSLVFTAFGAYFAWRQLSHAR